MKGSNLSDIIEILSFQIWLGVYTCLMIGSIIILILLYDPILGVSSNNIEECVLDETSNTTATICSEPEGKVWTAFEIILEIDRDLYWFFFCELILRFIVCPHKLSFIKDKYNIFDIIAIVPRAVIGGLFQTTQRDISDVLNVTWIQVYVRASSVLRVIRLINLARHFVASRVFIITLWESRKEIILLLSLYITCSTFYAVSVFYAESDYEGNVPTVASGIWWGLITMTTVGYGDMYPKSEMGKVIGVICAFSGVITTALPVAVIATNYNIIYRTAKVKERLKALEEKRAQLKLNGIN